MVPPSEGGLSLVGARAGLSGCGTFAKALIAANAERIIWGTDWPHPDSDPPPERKPTEVTPLYQIDDGRLLNQLAVWAPDAAIRKKIPVDNPARLYGF
jgi:predicted TIM-barrel fold metal-dependent hydrolase